MSLLKKAFALPTYYGFTTFGVGLLYSMPYFAILMFLTGQESWYLGALGGPLAVVMFELLGLVGKFIAKLGGPLEIIGGAINLGRVVTLPPIWLARATSSHRKDTELETEIETEKEDAQEMESEEQPVDTCPYAGNWRVTTEMGGQKKLTAFGSTFETADLLVRVEKNWKVFHGQSNKYIGWIDENGDLHKGSSSAEDVDPTNTLVTSMDYTFKSEGLYRGNEQVADHSKYMDG